MPKVENHEIDNPKMAKNTGVETIVSMLVNEVAEMDSINNEFIDNAKLKNKKGICGDTVHTLGVLDPSVFEAVSDIIYNGLKQTLAEHSFFTENVSFDKFASEKGISSNGLCALAIEEILMVSHSNHVMKMKTKSVLHDMALGTSCGYTLLLLMSRFGSLSFIFTKIIVDNVSDYSPLVTKLNNTLSLLRELGDAIFSKTESIINKTLDNLITRPSEFMSDVISNQVISVVKSHNTLSLCMLGDYRVIGFSVLLESMVNEKRNQDLSKEFDSDGGILPYSDLEHEKDTFLKELLPEVRGIRENLLNKFLTYSS